METGKLESKLLYLDGIASEFWSKIIFYTIFTILALTNAALQQNQNSSAKNSVAGSSNSVQINSNSLLVALLDSRYTELLELVEKALLMQTLEKAVSKHNVTVFAPRSEALERDLDPEFKRFLLEPGNLKSLQNMLLFHIIPIRIELTRRPLVRFFSKEN
ncbi:unnamed protein product [Fraxinus pennsylvanica]|uniref:FAS1 domain-containing protein n=1 Tax=Fraxinus pennsylvanica TaxID=56036 RepID=A0AAD2E3G1_9LAMI|nr:unnamed protein product [Fraxinus pennsylvanica]